MLENNSSNTSQFGFRIYKIIKDGPLDKGGAKELTDFIIPPQEVLNKTITFNDWILSLADKTIKIKLYSLLTRSFKEIEIKANPTGSTSGILGAGVKYEDYENADKRLLHVTSVGENSFAKNKLGLIPNDDYIIAVKTNNIPIISLNKNEFNPLEILNMVISYNKGNNLLFFIYNKKNGARTVEINIDKDENFVLGCDVAYGAWHEFPIEQSEVFEENENIKIDNDKKINKKEDNEIKNENNEKKLEKEKNIEKKNEDNDNKKEEEKDFIEEDII